MSKRLSLLFAISNDDASERLQSLKGQYARTLRALIQAGPKGITALEVAKTWALRLSHYVHILRRDHGLTIALSWEPHDGAAGPGRHGRYTLQTAARLIEGDEAEAA